MKRWEERWKKYKESYYACLRKKRLIYIGTLVWIVLRCLARRFFAGLPQGRRYRVAACLCMAATAAVLLLCASHSWMKMEGSHLSLRIQQKTDEIVEGYEDDIAYAVVLLNDGEDGLTDIRIYSDGEPDGIAELESEEGSGDTLAPGEQWKLALKVNPGLKAGKYFVTVVADAGELEETVEQTIRIVIKDTEMPEMTEAPEPTGTPEVTEVPELTGTPEVTEVPEPAGTPEVTELPEAAVMPVSEPVVTQIPRLVDVPRPKPSPEEVKATEMPTAEADEIIRVDVPANAHLFINPMAEEGQIRSLGLPLVNHSDFTLNVEVVKAVVDIRQNGGMVRKNCSLHMDILRDNRVVLAIRNLKEGMNWIDTSFPLSAEVPAYISFSGSVDEGTEHLWGEGDLHANVIFRFSKA